MRSLMMAHVEMLKVNILWQLIEVVMVMEDTLLLLTVKNKNS